MCLRCHDITSLSGPPVRPRGLDLMPSHQRSRIVVATRWCGAARFLLFPLPPPSLLMELLLAMQVVVAPV